MANPNRGEVVIRLGEKDHTVCFTINSICALEGELGLNINQIATQLNDVGNLSMRVIRALIWAGLLERNPEITLSEAGAFGGGDLQAVLGKVIEAFALAFPAAKGGKAKGSRP